MTKERRKQITDAMEKISEAARILNAALAEEQDLYDSMVGTEKERSKTKRNIDILGDACDVLDDQAAELRQIVR
mgnify:CR=1 FL=1